MDEIWTNIHHEDEREAFNEETKACGKERGKLPPACFGFGRQRPEAFAIATGASRLWGPRLWPTSRATSIAKAKMATDHFTLLVFTAISLVYSSIELCSRRTLWKLRMKVVGCQILLAAGASIEVRDEDGRLPLYDACAGGYKEIVSMLLRAANNQEQLKRVLDSFDIDGDTPLHHAARGNHSDVLQLLLDSGANPKISNLVGQCPADLADPDSPAQLRLNSAVEKLNAEPSHPTLA